MYIRVLFGKPEGKGNRREVAAWK